MDKLKTKAILISSTNLQGRHPGFIAEDIITDTQCLMIIHITGTMFAAPNR